MKFRLRLLLVAFAVSFLLVGALSAISISRFSRLNERVSSVEHSYEAVTMIDHLDRQVRELDRNAFLFLISGDSSFFRGFRNTSQLTNQILDSLRAVSSDNEKEKNFLVLFKTDMVLYYSAVLAAQKAGIAPDSVLNAPLYQETRTIMESAVDRLARLNEEEDRIRIARMAERDSYQAHTDKMVKALSAVFGTLTFILFFLLVREFRRRVIYQAELQQKIVEVAQSKQELEHIAYATSHDLQEPLRKIRILTDKWQHQQKSPGPHDSGDLLNRVVVAAARMQDLVSELMILTTLNNDAKMLSCPLNEYIGSAMASLDGTIKKKGASITIGTLPIIKGYPDQLQLLFKHLLDNALKFSQADQPPIVSITVRIADPGELDADAPIDRRYYCITIKDNGVGFDNKMADKMFGIFRQLHTVREGFIGKGSGLAICQRIMSNHKGRILAHGFPNTGATFKLYFPAVG